MSNWLYQFWFHGFKTAKHWGRGPQRWTADLLGFDAIHVISPMSVPASPTMNFGVTNIQPESSSLRIRTVHIPSQLCHWSIHYHSNLEYEPLVSRTPSPEPYLDPLDERSWKDWPSSSEQRTCQERLLESLAKNDFSNVKTEDLPIAVPQIAKTLEGPNDRFLEEAFGFGIMARNANVLMDLKSTIVGNEEAEKKIRELNPLHLAFSYLDGSKTCCSIFQVLFDLYGFLFRPNDQNKMGHTVFDNLMMAILKSHTSIAPGTVDDALSNEKRFPGEEVDICGRWDADSDCIRELFKAGDSGIPFEWKHKFCHTSVQVIGHCIVEMSLAGILKMDSSSGLFIKRCVSCGLKMQVQPLHTVVLTAFFLAHFGAQDEDLFGILAVLLEVLGAGANPLQTVDISIRALFPYEASNAATTECNHRHYTPLKLADSVPSSIVESWSIKKRTGWEIFCQVLRLSGNLWESRKMQLRGGCRHPGYRQNFVFRGSRELAVLSAAVQAEYLTYRRIKETDPWLSQNFDMDAIRECLERGEMPMFGFFENDMVHPVCECGGFKVRTQHPYLPRAQEIMKYHFSNLEDWSRTTFVEDRFENFW